MDGSSQFGQKSFLGRGLTVCFPTPWVFHPPWPLSDYFSTLTSGVPKPDCFKPGRLQFLRRSALLRSFAPFCALAFALFCAQLRVFACFCVRPCLERPCLGTAGYHARGNKYTSNSWRIFEVYVFVLNSNSLFQDIFSRICICICHERNSWEGGETCVSHSNSMVLRSFLVSVCAFEFPIQVLKQKNAHVFPFGMVQGTRGTWQGGGTASKNAIIFLDPSEEGFGLVKLRLSYRENTAATPGEYQIRGVPNLTSAHLFLCVKCQS